jgi:predicted nucleic acid-binding protein
MRVLEESHTLVLSNEIITEVTKVLRYPKFKSLYGLSESSL